MDWVEYYEKSPYAFDSEMALLSTAGLRSNLGHEVPLEIVDILSKAEGFQEDNVALIAMDWAITTVAKLAAFTDVKSLFMKGVLQLPSDAEVGTLAGLLEDYALSHADLTLFDKIENVEHTAYKDLREGSIMRDIKTLVGDIERKCATDYSMYIDEDKYLHMVRLAMHIFEMNVSKEVLKVLLEVFAGVKAKGGDFNLKDYARIKEEAKRLYGQED